MRKIGLGASILALCLAAPAWASDENRCENPAGAASVPAASIRSSLHDLGYRVGKMRKAYGPGNLGDRPRDPAGPNFSSFSQFMNGQSSETPFSRSTIITSISNWARASRSRRSSTRSAT